MAMRVQVPILTAHGMAEYEVDAKNINEARSKVMAGEGTHVETKVVHYKLNFDAIREVGVDPAQSEGQASA